MRILFVLSQKALLRHFDSVVVGLAGRGHLVTIAAADRQKALPLPDAFLQNPRIREVTAPASRADGWIAPAKLLRGLADYWRYLEDGYLTSGKLRQRALRKLVQAAAGDDMSHLKMRCPACRHWIQDEQWTDALRRIDPQIRQTFRQLLHLAESALPVDPAIRSFLKSQRPDVVLVTPLLNLGASQADFVHAARSLAIPTVFPVFSWDNLSNKGLIHALPDRVLVWNERQRREAVSLHGVAEDRIFVTGAPRFDDFIELAPSCDRAAFCARTGLDPARQIIVYLGSSEFTAPQERSFVEGWIEAVRKAPDARLREANLVIRPHPRKRKEWATPPASARTYVSVSDLANADQELFDCLYHGAAAVGLNTSAEIEAALVGRPVYTILEEAFAGGQAGTLHFHLLLQEHGGFVVSARTMDEHVAHLSDAVHGRYDRERIDAFRTAFARPRGWASPAAPFAVQAIEDAGRPGAWARAVRRLRGLRPAGAGR